MELLIHFYISIMWLALYGFIGYIASKILLATKFGKKLNKILFGGVGNEYKRKR